MSAIRLDLSKLLGFKIIAKEFPNSQQVLIGAKLGEKPGLKGSRLSDLRIGAKIGSKVGSKSGSKMR